MNICEKEGSGVSKMKGGSWDSWTQIIEEKSRVGDEEVIDVEWYAFSGALGVFHPAQPTFRPVNP